MSDFIDPVTKQAVDLTPKGLVMIILRFCCQYLPESYVTYGTENFKRQQLNRNILGVL